MILPHLPARRLFAFPIPLIGGVKRRPIRDLQGLPQVLIRHKSLELRLATTKADIRKAQRLRYHVFYELGHASGRPRETALRRDICPFDRICDHLLIYDNDHRNRFGEIKPKVIGSYRLLRGDVAARHNGFYSGKEFDLSPMLRANAGRRFLELGRSCVHPKYRSKKVIDLLWKGVGLYAQHHAIDMMFGCASFPGTDVALFRNALSLLYQKARAEGPWNVEPLEGQGIAMDLVPKDAMDEKTACALLPPLIKGYLRVGARFASSAVIDARFGTIDVFTILAVSDVPGRYNNRFGRTASIAL